MRRARYHVPLAYPLAGPISITALSWRDDGASPAAHAPATQTSTPRGAIAGLDCYSYARKRVHILSAVSRLPATRCARRPAACLAAASSAAASCTLRHQLPHRLLTLRLTAPTPDGSTHIKYITPSARSRIGRRPPHVLRRPPCSRNVRTPAPYQVHVTRLRVTDGRVLQMPPSSSPSLSRGCHWASPSPPSTAAPPTASDPPPELPKHTSSVATCPTPTTRRP